MDPTTVPPRVPQSPSPQPMRPLPQAQAAPALPPPPTPGGPGTGERPTIDEAPGDAAVQLSFWQHPFVQNVLPFLTSLVLHIGLILLALILFSGYKAARQLISKEQITVADATIAEGPEGGIPHPGLGGDPNRDAAQDKDLNVPPDSQGIAEKQGRDLSQRLEGGGSGDSVDSTIGVSANGQGMGAGKGAGGGKGDAAGSGAGDGSGLLAPFGVPGGGGGIGPKSTFIGVSGNAKKIVFVLDATGSMMSSFDSLRVQLRQAVTNLRLPQQFDIVFINEHNPPPLAPTLLFVTPENKRKAQEYVDTMAPRGGTNPLPALEKAFGLQPELIYFLVDPSDFPDKKAVLDLVNAKAAGGKIKMNIIAFEGNDPENNKFLQDLAKSTGGVYRFVTSKDLQQ
jgi:von Willebrand factor type A domain